MLCRPPLRAAKPRPPRCQIQRLDPPPLNLSRGFDLPPRLLEERPRRHRPRRQVRMPRGKVEIGPYKTNAVRNTSHVDPLQSTLRQRPIKSRPAASLIGPPARSHHAPARRRPASVEMPIRLPGPRPMGVGARPVRSRPRQTASLGLPKNHTRVAGRVTFRAIGRFVSPLCAVDWVGRFGGSESPGRLRTCVRSWRSRSCRRRRATAPAPGSSDRPPSWAGRPFCPRPAPRRARRWCARGCGGPITRSSDAMTLVHRKGETIRRIDWIVSRV